MSLGCHWHVTRKSGVSDEDAMRMLATCPQQFCVSGSWNLDNDTQTDGHRRRRPADQSGKRVASWTGKSPDTPNTRDILVTSSRGCRACRACWRGCHEDATRKLSPWNLSYACITKSTRPNLTKFLVGRYLLPVTCYLWPCMTPFSSDFRFCIYHIFTSCADRYLVVIAAEFDCAQRMMTSGEICYPRLLV